jgi:cytochrome c2
MKPQEPIPHNYRMETLNKVFAFSALALLFITGVVVIYDYARGWKRFQLEFQRIQADRVREELATASKATNRAEIERLDREVALAEEEIARRRRDYRGAQERFQDWEGRLYAADQDYRFAKATLDALRYDAEVAKLQKKSGWQEKVREYEDLTRRVDELKLRLEDVTKGHAAAQADLDRFTKRIDEIEEKKEELNASIERLEKQLEAVETNAQFVLLNSPLLDFISPTLKIDQVVVADSFVNLNYMSMPRVDRCMTCHRAIDRQGFESKKEAARLQAELEEKMGRFEIPAERHEETRARIAQLEKIQNAKKDLMNPFRTHPYLDTYVGSSSPHPLQDYGCTSCHRGEGRATDFARAGHAPYTLRQRDRWIETLSWKEQPYLETPMHPRHFSQAACIKCHGGEMEVARGERVNEGMARIELYGCHSCHKIANWRFANLRKPGPDLNGIAEKTTPEWVVRWLSNPTHFRATTRMPSFFYQRNMVGPAVDKDEAATNRRMQNTEIHALTAFLFARSSRRDWTPPAAAGDAARGERLVATVGCLGCHVTDETVKDPETGATRVARRDDVPIERIFGFNLTGTATKTNPGWLFHWLKDPRNYYPDAPMPDLRLSDQEAADITAWLMTRQKPTFLQQQVPVPDRAALDELTKSYLLNTMPIREADARIRAMSDHEKYVYLGERTIEKYGCYSCHSIRGFEDAKPIGTELTVEGSKNLHLFDFGFVHDYEAHDGKHEHIQHTTASWIFNKLRSPRIYDDKREKAYHDKLKMPNFYMTREEAREIGTVILGLTKEKVAESRLAGNDPHKRMIEEGRKRVSQNNCRGCHVVDRQGRAIASTIADDGMLPPDLSPEGDRVQSPWLFEFLKDPTVMTMRPWLGVRMPTFHFSDEETNTLVAYFAAQGNEPQFDTMRRRDPAARNVQVGETIFEMLRCAQCHPTGGAAVNTADLANLAPNLEYSRVRLRHDWIPDWIRRPDEIIPGTKMPTNFPRDPKTGHFTSPLLLAIDSPQFAAYKSRLISQIGNEAEMRKVLGDVERTTDYLRDYIWTLGPSEMRINRSPSASPAPGISAPSLPAMRSSRNGMTPAQSQAAGR